MSALAAVASLLRTRVGLDPDTLGAGALADAVRRRTAACGAADFAAYLALLREDAAEWQALVETVVVAETWFFRDREPFALLARWVAGDHAKGARDEQITVLSLPCATGEEAWSIAIVLAAAGIRPDGIRIEAFDVSERALAAARTGRYRQRSLRGGCPQPAWARYLVDGNDGTVAVADALHATVHFASGNLVDAARTFAGRQFDCVFSRNLLIYCDAAARAAALDTFAALVRPDGLLVLGHAETLPIGNTAFVREGPPGAFAWRRVHVSPPSVTPASRRRFTDVRTANRRRDAGATKSGATANVDPWDARALADAGRLDDAAARVESDLARTPDDADAHALLGVVRAAQGRDDEAAQCLRRALYLDPEHEEALIHLAVILERRGEAAAAIRLRNRARRRGAADGTAQ